MTDEDIEFLCSVEGRRAVLKAVHRAVHENLAMATVAMELHRLGLPHTQAREACMKRYHELEQVMDAFEKLYRIPPEDDS